MMAQDPKSAGTLPRTGETPPGTSAVGAGHASPGRLDQLFRKYGDAPQDDLLRQVLTDYRKDHPA